MDTPIERAKDVHVCAYLRTRRGRREAVREHRRRHPCQLSFAF